MEKKKIMLSVALAVYNEQQNLAECLSSVRSFADEIIVVDGGSTDRTVDIAKQFTSRIIRTDNPPMFHINKQKALDACHGIWILQMDADERITPALQQEILSVVSSGPSDINGYFIPRRNHFWGHVMRKGGQYPDYVIRLVLRGKARFPAKSVHEQIEITGKTAYLHEPMEHISYRTREDYWKKADAYTTLTAMEMKKSGVRKSVWTWILYNIIKPKITFITLFFRHKGFMDGRYGFIFAVFSALHFPIAYKKFVRLFVLLAIFYVLCAVPVQAGYVLPYPSYMPGNSLYRVSRIIDRVKAYWYWGTIAQVKYHLALSDKYLVEAKTLFEYKQYLLATDALARSDKQLLGIPMLLSQGEKEKKDMGALRQTTRDAMEVHARVLGIMESQLPKEFIWQPEKVRATTLEIGSLLSSSLSIRRSIEDNAGSR